MRVIVNHLDTQYFDQGHGPLVLCLHGWGDQTRTFDDLASVLEPQYRVMRLDLPGFGGTQIPPADWSVADYVQFVAAFIDKLQLEPYSLIGH